MHYKAFLFDLNGTIIDDMQYHSDAWFHILNELGADMTREEVDVHMYGKNVELLVRIFGKDAFTDEEMQELSVNKEKAYQEKYRPHLALIKGLQQFLDKAAQQNILMAIGSAAIMFNIDYVLDGLHIRSYFKALVSADDVKNSKPDPETFLKCATALGVEPEECIVFEDAPKGVEAALHAGMKAVVITTSHQQEDFKGLSNILMFINDYTDSRLDEL